MLMEKTQKQTVSNINNYNQINHQTNYNDHTNQMSQTNHTSQLSQSSLRGHSRPPSISTTATATATATTKMNTHESSILCSSSSNTHNRNIIYQRDSDYRVGSAMNFNPKKELNINKNQKTNTSISGRARSASQSKPRVTQSGSNKSHRRASTLPSISMSVTRGSDRKKMRRMHHKKNPLTRDIGEIMKLVIVGSVLCMTLVIASIVEGFVSVLFPANLQVLLPVISICCVVNVFCICFFLHSNRQLYKLCCCSCHKCVARFMTRVFG